MQTFMQVCDCRIMVELVQIVLFLCRYVSDKVGIPVPVLRFICLHISVFGGKIVAEKIDEVFGQKYIEG